jgi:hypothetical protein
MSSIAGSRISTESRVSDATTYSPAKHTITVSECADLLWPDLRRIDKSNHENSLCEEEGVNEDYRCSYTAICADLVGIKFAQAAEASKEEENDTLDEEAKIERDSAIKYINSEDTCCCTNDAESIAKLRKPRRFLNAESSRLEERIGVGCDG